jgi:hypothetical protein
MAEKRFSSLDPMLARLDQRIEATRRAMVAVPHATWQAIRAEADPAVLVSTLVEGIAMTLLANVPPDEQQAAANDAENLLHARLQSLGMGKP